VSVETAGEALGVGRNSAYSAIKSGEIPHIRIGRRIAVPTAPIRKMLGIDEPRT
jgi:excisionase family DNA binding protein